ncbi:MAG: peptide-methionine (S)-S-oxide reductase MsrA [Planctomycetota bacterium]|nr:peptide-methionine (S)-S-oxide reductase MsrA [Planctomycetota bacterium]MDA1177328.1 peptide-methionine (S)-S-oxide reductase MsrA [Planctomycetota bacterium]
MKSTKLQMPTAENALRGREQAIEISVAHYVNGNPLAGDFPGMQRIAFGMGCFWGAERLFWEIDGVFSTAVGYAGGFTKNPTYEEVCSGATGHAEVVLVIYDPQKISLDRLFQVFWENHDPTQGMRQGNDVGTQYRSTIYCYDDDQLQLAEESLKVFQQSLRAAGFGTISTEVTKSQPFYYAEAYHQQYLGKQPWGYCGLAGTGVTCPTGLKVK